MTVEQAKALRPYFHGLTDEQFTEMISEWPLNNISKGMDDYALHIAEQAVEEEKAGFRKKGGTGFGSHVCDNILSRIKQLTEEE